MIRIRSEQPSGFTLLEVLTVVGIIGVLTAFILTALLSSRIRAQKGQVQSDEGQFAKVLLIAEDATRQDLSQITGNGWSGGVCIGYNLSGVSTSDPCYVAWQNVLTTVQTASGDITQGLTNLSRDPWKSPYIIDENVREFGPADCRVDTFTSAGPDGLYQTADDIVYSLPQSKPCP